MMKKLSLLIGSAALVWAQSATAETWNSPTAQTGWGFAGSTATATSVTSMKMLMQMSSLVKKNHWYRMTGTVSGYSGSGSLRFFVGYSMPAAPTGSWVTLASTSDIADNFTTSLGLRARPPSRPAAPATVPKGGGAIPLSMHPRQVRARRSGRLIPAWQAATFTSSPATPRPTATRPRPRSAPRG
jgi:hypothetical protein